MWKTVKALFFNCLLLDIINLNLDKMENEPKQIKDFLPQIIILIIIIVLLTAL